MTDATRPISVETLLAQRPWVEALARSLVLDQATADDVTQQAWLAAIENPPAEHFALRGWLSRVVRNAAFESHRRATRRARNETAAAVRAEEPSPAETVARAEAHRRVVDAVMALDEPYRTAILLRFFEGLESDGVARRTGVPIETARTRVKRALALLRGRLDREHGGDGRSWGLALLPLAAARKGMLVAAKGGVVMAGTTKSIMAAGIVGALLGALLTGGAMSLRDASTAKLERGSESTQAMQIGSRSPAEVPNDRSSQSAASRHGAPASDGASNSSASRPSLAAVLEGIAVELPRAGTGRITGHVKATDGSPLAGAVIRATLPREASFGNYRQGPLPARPSVEDSVRDAAVAAKWDAATTRDAVSDASGAYALTGLVDAAYVLAAGAEGWVVRPAARGSDYVKPDKTVDFVATAIVDVQVSLLLPDGTPPKEKVLVRWSEPKHGGGSYWWTPEQAVVQIPPGTWNLTAEIGEELRARPVLTSVTVGGASAPVTLQIAGRNIVSGKVVFDPADAGWTYVWLTARRRDTGVEEKTRSDARAPEWKFRFEDLEPGDYELTAALDSRTPIATAAVHATGGPVTQDIVVPRLTVEQALTLRVTGRDGKPVPADEVDVAIVERFKGGMSNSGVRPTGRPDGSMGVPLPARAHPNEHAQHVVQVRSKLHGLKEVEFDRGTTQTVEIQFGEVALFQPTIAGAERTELANRLRVTLTKTDEAGPEFPHRASTLPLEPGDYVALLWLADGEHTRRVIGRTPMHLGAGPNPVTIQVPELYSLTIRIPGAEKGTRMYVSTAVRPARDVGSQELLLSEDGAVTAKELPAGLYLVQVTLAGEAREMIVRVQGTGEVAFVPTSISGLLVSVTDASGALAKAGFQSGDVIVTMDGTAIDTLRRLDELLYAAQSKDAMPVEVTRGARRVTLTIEPAKFWARGDHGGRWEPVMR